MSRSSRSSRLLAWTCYTSCKRYERHSYGFHTSRSNLLDESLPGQVQQRPKRMDYKTKPCQVFKNLCFGDSASGARVSRAVVVVSTLAHPISGFECGGSGHTNYILAIVLGDITFFTLHPGSVVVVSTSAHPISSTKVCRASGDCRVFDPQEIPQALVGEHCIAYGAMQLTPVAPNTVPIVVVAALAHPVAGLESRGRHDGLAQVPQERTLRTCCASFVIVVATFAHPIAISKAFRCRDNGLRLHPHANSQKTQGIHYAHTQTQHHATHRHTPGPRPRNSTRKSAASG